MSRPLPRTDGRTGFLGWSMLLPAIAVIVAWTLTIHPYRNLRDLLRKLWGPRASIAAEWHVAALQELGLKVEPGKSSEEIRTELLDHLGQRTGSAQSKLAVAEYLAVSIYRLEGTVLAVVAGLVLLGSGLLVREYGWDWLHERREAGGIWNMALVAALGMLVIGLAGWASLFTGAVAVALPPFAWITGRMIRRVRRELGLAEPGSREIPKGPSRPSGYET